MNRYDRSIIRTALQPSEDTRANGRKALVFLLFLLLIPAYWIGLNAPAVGYFHDDGIYVVTAKALAEGKGYRIISLPGEIVQTKYPILFPALLAIVWKIFPSFPENAIFLKMVPLIGTFLWAWILKCFFKEKDGGTNYSTGIILTTLALPAVVFYSVTILSETIFAFFCTGALIFLHRLEDNTGNKEGRILFFAAVFAAAAFLARTAGFPLIIAGALSLFLRRRYSSVVKFIVMCGIIVLPWILWQTVFNTENNGVYAYYSSSNYQHWNILANYSLSQTSIVLAFNFIILLFAPIRLITLGYINFYFTCFLSIIAFVFVLFGFLSDLRKGIKTIHIFLILYYGMILAWLWNPIRFLLPIFPFWLYFAYKGFTNSLGSISIKKQTLAIVNHGLILFLAILLGIGLFSFSLTTLHLNQPRIGSLVEKADDNWLQFRSLLDWVRDNTPSDAVLLGMIDPAIYLYTDRKAVRGFQADPYLLWYSDKSEESLGNVSDLVNYLVEQKVDYIIRTPSEMFKESPIYNHLLDKLFIRYKASFQLVKEGVDPRYRIYQVDLDRLRKMRMDK